MTAEIAIINRQAIALAADSAVTIGKERVWKHTNKIFSLGPENDIAIMIYGSGEFAGFPWDTIVKTFRAEKGGKRFATVEECGETFTAFLRDRRFAPDHLNRVMNLAPLLVEMNKIKRELPDHKKVSDFKDNLSAKLDETMARYLEQPKVDQELTYKGFCASHDKAMLRDLAEGEFGQRINSALTEKLSRTLYEFFQRRIESLYSTGVVVAGYGREEFFPCVRHYKVDGRDGGFVRSWLHDVRDTNEDKRRKTVIIPFAQSDIFHLFMEGISPDYIGFINLTLGAVLDAKSDVLVKSYVSDPDERMVEAERQRRDNDSILGKFEQEFTKFRRTRIVNPILDVVRALPKEEMAEMAAALVELTSLRRKVDSKVESVGGPVDVAVISKGDGLIWIERKHYFEIDKNQEFLYRKAIIRSDANGQSR